MQNLPPDPKFSEKRTITNYFFYLALYQDFSPVLACYLYRQVIRQFVLVGIRHFLNHAQSKLRVLLVTAIPDY